MAVKWSWKDKMGRITFEDYENNKFVVNIYRGNCLAVLINEWREEGKDKYNVYSFFLDADHLKRVAKDDPKIFFYKVKTIRLNTYYKESITLLKTFTQVGYKVTAYYKKPK